MPTKFIRAVLFNLVLTTCLAASAKANSTYAYNGNPFTDFFGTGSCPPACNISGSFTVSTPLPANESSYFLTPISFSFGDAAFMANPLNSSALIGVDTNTTGTIDGWVIVFSANSGLFQISSLLTDSSDTDELAIYNDLDNLTGTAGNVNDDGTWSSPSQAPEPSSLALLCVGVFGLLGLLFHRLQSGIKPR
jgi:hypothetical protein